MKPVWSKTSTIALILALLISLLPGISSPVQALSATIVISQVYGGGGNSGATYSHDFIELFNRGPVPASLAGWSLQYASAAGTGNLGSSATQLTELPDITLQPGQYFLIQEAQGSGGTSALPTPDAIDATPIAMSATGGKVALVNSTVSLGCNGGSTPCSPDQTALIIDLVGWDGANFFETNPAPATSNTTAILRNGGGCIETDDNGADFSVGGPAPRNTSAALNACSTQDAAPQVSVTFPAQGAADVTPDANLSVSFSESVYTFGEWFHLSCTVSGAHSATVSGGPVDFSLDPDADFIAGESCTLTLVSANISDQDANDPPDGMQADFVLNFQSADVCSVPFTPIYSIQGSGETAAITSPVTTRGVVVGDYEYPGSGTTSSFLRGFFVQDMGGDGDTATSDGIFVFNGSSNSVAAGDVVVVSGTPAEFQGQTQIGSVTAITTCGTGAVEPVDVTFPLPSATYLEQFEGMLVRLPQTMVVTEHFQLGRFGQVVVSANERLNQPTSIVLPGAPALELQAANNLNKIILDDGTNVQNPDPIVFARGGQPLSATNTLRGGDTATGIVGVLNYTWAGNSASPNAYRVRPVNALGGWVEFVAVNERPEQPADAGGELKVVGMNLLNYFNTFDGLPDSVDNCVFGLGGAPADCRGADTPVEFDRQWTKTVAAILVIDPDVLGVNEIENDGYGPDSAIQDLVNKLNAATAAGTYAFIDADAATGEVNALGTDAIKVGMIYKPARVNPLGAAALNTVEFVNGGDTAPRSRPALAVTFQQVSDGAVFTVATNHLKSKGSACDLPDAGDGQGNCNIVRTNAANELAAWLAGDPTGSGDPDVLIIGDLNSYAMEDPISALKTAGYTNLVETVVGAEAYSYVFDGQWGYLDYALANPDLLSQVAGVVEYHINADEPSTLDYNTDFKTTNLIETLYAPDQYRISDHDPIIVGLNLNAAPVVNAGGPYTVVEGSSVTVAASGSDPDGEALSYTWDLDNDGVFETEGQSAAVAGSDGPAVLTVRVLVSDGRLTATAETTVTVTNSDPLAGAISLSASLTAVNQNITSEASFSDAGLLDTHSAVWDWGDGTSSPATVTETNGSGSASGNHAYTAAGFYTVTLTVTDKDGGTGQSVSEQIVVYDPNGGYLIGGGTIHSPAGAYPAEPGRKGLAVFAFAVKYRTNSSIPTGATTFQFAAGRMLFTSNTNEWLVVQPDLSTAVLQGKGRVNGKGNYMFRLWAGDGTSDTLRMKIWKVENGVEIVVYDNGAGQTIHSGTILIRK